MAQPEAIAESAPADSENHTDAFANQETTEPGTVRVESPSIADDNPPSWPSEQDPGWGLDSSDEEKDTSPETDLKTSLKLPWPTQLKTSIAKLWPKRKDRGTATSARPSSPADPRSSIKGPAIVVALAALCAGLIIWRTDVVRLLPQTAICFKAIGLAVNLRGLAFDHVLVRTETVDGANILVIEGTIVGTTNMPVEIPRLHFTVRDDHGAEIYAWDAVLEQAVLKAGETVSFRSRLASPPAEGHDIDVRFFNRRDLLRGAA